MKQFVIFLVVLLMCASLASAAIDDSNPYVVMYRDTFGAPYDYYQEVYPGDTFRVDVVMNRNPSWFTPINSFLSALWWDPAVVDNLYNGTVHPLPNYALSWMTSYTQPAQADYEVGNYAQLTSDHNTGEGEYIWEQPADDPFVLISWDIPIRTDASLGETQIGLRFITYDLFGMTVDRTDDELGLTINVLPEPATLSLLGLGGLAFLRRRKK